VIVLDTTILVYAVGADHSLRSPTRALIESIRDDLVRATTTVEVVQEFAHVRARRRSCADAAALATEYAVGLSPLVQPEQEDLVEGLVLFGASESLGPFDAVLAATARRRGWALASADRSFGQVDGLVHLNPSSATFLDQVGTVG
jgi:uncharacterized protein